MEKDAVMKNYILLIVLCAFVSSAVADTMYSQHDYPFGDGIQMCCRNDDVSNTFMFTRPFMDNVSTIQALWHTILYKKDHSYGASVQAIGLYQQSLELERTQHYFLPAKCERVLVAGDDVFQDLEIRQIRAEWFNLPSTFQGTFTLHPKQKQAGVILEYSQDVGKVIEHSFFEGSWVNIALPVTIVENNMHINEDVFVSGPSFNMRPITIIGAFNQPDWKYAKICPNTMTQVKLADITLNIGKTFLAQDDFVVAYSSVIVIPTGNIQDAHYLFEPVAGNNGHFGIGGRVDFQFPLTNPDSCHTLCFFLDFESVFFARNRQWRTFDLKGKPYSRYLQFVSRDDPSGELISGVNILTRWVQVHPYNLADLSLGFRFKTEHIEIEVGYSIWGHGDEKIRILRDSNCCDTRNRELDPFERYGIAGNPNPSGPHQRPALNCCQLPMPATASKSTIACQAANDLECEPNVDKIIGECSGPLMYANGDTQRVFVPITQFDIDLQSGAAQSAFNHKFQLAFGYIHRGQSMDIIVGAGGYYDKPVKSGALNVLGAWLKMGASF